MILFTDGGESPSDEEAARLRRYRVEVRAERVTAFEGGKAGLRAVLLTGGDRIERAAVFVGLGQHPASDLARRLECEGEEGNPIVEAKQRTCVPGVYVASDAAKDVQFAIAAAEGARAAHADIHQALRREDKP